LLLILWQTWPTDSEEYELLLEVGHGAFATVFLAYCPALNVRIFFPVVLAIFASFVTKRFPFFYQERCAIKVMEMDSLEQNFDEIRVRFYHRITKRARA
jgi:hypothetical protein